MNRYPMHDFLDELATPHKLCDYEMKLLRELVTGVKDPDLRWGAAMSVALEFLQEMGYLTRTANVKPTDKARALFQ